MLKRVGLLAAVVLFCAGGVFLMKQLPVSDKPVQPGASSPASVSSVGRSASGLSTTQPQLQANALAVAVTAQDKEKAAILEQVIASKNDNDPRLDQELRVLSHGARYLFRESYRSHKPEARNERGTIVFLLGRNLDSAEDFDFLGQVLRETPCRSLESCDRDSPRDSGEHAHFESGVETTLAYPQIVALKAIEKFLASSNQDPALRAKALAELHAARDSKIRRVSELAESVLASATSR